MNTVIIGDVHNRVDLVCKILDRHQGCQFVFIGDYFDSFTDDPSMARHTALWLRDSLKQPNRTHLWGNHDVQYAFGMANLRVTGYSLDKDDVINEVMKHEDWNRLKFFHVHDHWWFSHAGVTSEWFEHPIHGLDKSTVEQEIQRARKDLASRRMPLSLCSYDDMSNNPAGIGGLLWVRWNRLVVIPGVHQIVGHTQCDQVLYKRGVDSMNINVDCLYREYLEIDQGGNVYARNTNNGEITAKIK
jgi:hypothetical protein